MTGDRRRDDFGSTGMYTCGACRSAMGFGGCSWPSNLLFPNMGLRCGSNFSTFRGLARGWGDPRRLVKARQGRCIFPPSGLRWEELRGCALMLFGALCRERSLAFTCRMCRKRRFCVEGMTGKIPSSSRANREFGF